MTLDLLRLALGGVMLYFGAEWLVRGAAGVAKSFGVAPLVVGLTVVSYGTSAPELAVSVTATLDFKGAIALGNVVGSNIANIGLILGLVALIAPPKVDGGLIQRELPLLLLASVALPLMLIDGQLGRIDGPLLFCCAIVFTVATFRRVAHPSDASHSESPPAEEEKEEALGRTPLMALLAVGLVVLTGGGYFFVDGAANIAESLGVSHRVIGLTVVAFGTSVPELAASLVAALRGHSDIAVGNVIGSNLFNILLILGITPMVRPLPGSLSVLSFDIGVMLLFTVATMVSMRKSRRIGRPEGALYLIGYLSFIGALAYSS
ncbi:MAG: calcium/sodium antiporter [Polyangiaceae bacterium]|nr:calcium/sodium antiporter [Polyangiaceae bacterium]